MTVLKHGRLQNPERETPFLKIKKWVVLLWPGSANLNSIISMQKMQFLGQHNDKSCFTLSDFLKGILILPSFLSPKGAISKFLGVLEDPRSVSVQIS